MPLPAEEVAAIVNRLRRARGQLDGVLRMIDEERDFEQVVTQLAAVSHALDRAGYRLIAAELKRCLADDPDGKRVDALERLFLSLA